MSYLNVICWVAGIGSFLGLIAVTYNIAKKQ
jgi:hypothetical protein